MLQRRAVCREVECYQSRVDVQRERQARPHTHADHPAQQGPDKTCQTAAPHTHEVSVNASELTQIQVQRRATFPTRVLKPASAAGQCGESRAAVVLGSAPAALACWGHTVERRRRQHSGRRRRSESVEFDGRAPTLSSCASCCCRSCRRPPRARHAHARPRPAHRAAENRCGASWLTYVLWTLYTAANPDQIMTTWDWGVLGYIQGDRREGRPTNAAAPSDRFVTTRPPLHGQRSPVLLLTRATLSLLALCGLLLPRKA